MSTCLVLLIGLPGAGKTTLCQQLLAQAGDFEFIHVCFDDILPLNLQRKLALDSTELGFQVVRKELLQVIRNVVGAGDSSVSTVVDSDLSLILNSFSQKFKVDFKDVVSKNKNPVIIIDDNNYYKSMRYAYYQLARDNNLGFCQIYVQCGLTEAINKNAARSQPIPHEVLVKMSDKLEPPDESNTWEAQSLTVQSEKMPINKILDLIYKSVCNPVPPLPDNSAQTEESRQICSANTIHRIDQILRKLVSKHIAKLRLQGDSGSGVRALGDKRKVVLAEIKGGVRVLPSDILQGIEVSGFTEDMLASLTDHLEALLVY